MENEPVIREYDFGLGVEPDIIDYIQESHVIQSRISPTRCYLLHQTDDGELVSDPSDPDNPIVIASWDDTAPQYMKKIWIGGDDHPDIRPHVNEGEGAITVYIDGVSAGRVLDIVDMVSDAEYAVVQRLDLISKDIEIVFNIGFDAGSHIISYKYYTLNEGISPTIVKDGASTDESKHGWSQYLNPDPQDPLRGVNQILVRTPLTQEAFTINEEGSVILKENKCWMIWVPYVYASDILIVPISESPNGKELRFIITDKNDSRIQGRLVSQRFRIVLLEETDPRYDITYLT